MNSAANETAGGNDNLKAFAAAVLANVARITDSKMLTGNGKKAFIAAILPGSKVGDRVCKEMLVAAHRAGYLTLSRCDLTPAYDRAVIQASHTTYLNAEFHFIARAA